MGTVQRLVKRLKKKEYIRHLWFAESSTFLDGRRWDEIEKSKQTPQTRTKNEKPIDFRDCSFDALIQLNIMKVCYNEKAAFSRA